MEEKDISQKKIHGSKNISDALKSVKDISPSFLDKYSLPEGLKEELGSMSWETIANLSDSLEVKIKKESDELRRVEKHLSMTILVLKDRIRHSAAHQNFDTKFLVDLVNLLEKTERLSIQHEIDLSEFMLFVKIILEKLKKEKLIMRDFRTGAFVQTKSEKITEFSKMMEPPDLKEKRKIEAEKKLVEAKKLAQAKKKPAQKMKPSTKKSSKKKKK